MKSENTRKFPLRLTLALVAVFAGNPAFGQSTTWTGTSGDWFTPGNWSAGVPDALSLIEIQNDGTAQIASGTALGRNLYVGTVPASSGTLLLSGTSILSLMTEPGTPGGVGFLEIGTSGTGLVEVSDSARLILLDTRVGNGVGGVGTLNVSGGAIESADLVIGVASPGTVNLSGSGVWEGWNGQAGLGATLRVGSQGTLNLSENANWTSDGGGNNRINGVVNVGDNASVSTVRRTWIGVSEGDTGTLNVSGGSYALTDLWVGLDGLGEMEISGTGSVSSTSSELGLNALGAGTAVVSGGSWANAGDLLVGKLGQGSLEIGGGGLVSNDGPITVGVAGTGTLTIGSGGSLSNTSAVIAQDAGSTGTVVISDGTWTNTGELTVGAVGDASLTMSNDAVVSSTGLFIAQHVDSTASMIMDSSASLQVPGGTVSVGFDGGLNGTTGNASLTVNGASVSANRIDVNAQGTGSASLSVSGNSSLSTNEVRFASQGSSLVPDTVTVNLTGGNWTNSGTMIFGTGADAEINVSGTASITSQNMVLWAFSGTVLSISGGSVGITNRLDSTVNGVMRVSGSGILNVDELLLRQGATTQIFDGGQVFATELMLGAAGQTPGALTVSGASGSRGLLEFSQITYNFGSATDPGVMIFDGGIFRTAADQTTLFSGFSAGNVRLEAGGGFFDSNGFNLATSYDLTGPGGLTKQGAGTFELAGTNSYAGPTDIHSGELRVTGSTGAGVVQIAGGGVLSGTGTVADLHVAGGTLAPGVGGLGTLSAGNTSFGGGTWMVEISSALSASKLSVTGSAGLTANTELAISAINGYITVAGDSWTILDNDGVDAFSLGSFRFTSGGALIEPLTPFDVAGNTFLLDYQGGDGNDVVLNRINPDQVFADRFE